jgi:acetylornithine deacetylase/succinyl-diaminopimelate desuccinylase-like protein
MRGIFKVLALFSALLAEVQPSFAALPDGIDEAAIRKAAAAIFPEYFQLLAIPSDSAVAADIVKNADWLVAAFARRGFQARPLENEGKPLVYAEYGGNRPGRPTILFYLHFDAQPVIPEQWSQKDPWIPVVKRKGADGKWAEVPDSALFRPDFDPELRVFARDSADDKGPIAMFLACFDLLRERKLAPAVNVKVLLDSEEEKNSAGISKVVAANRTPLASDALVVLDGAAHPSGRPTIVFGNRGATPITITVFGPKSPLHSGHYGNWAPNPALLLSKLLAGMKDDDGRVTIPGYYDRTRLTAEDRKILAEVPDDDAALNRRLGIKEPDKVGATYQEALQYPSLNIRGLAAAGVGAKAANIVPHQAVAEIDIRTTVESDSAYLGGLIRKYVEDQGYFLVDHDPTDAERAAHARLARFEIGKGDEAARQDIASRVGSWADKAARMSSGTTPVRLRQMGGTVPTAELVHLLEIPFILAPTVNPDDNQHTFDENLRMGHFLSGMQTMLGMLLTAY